MGIAGEGSNGGWARVNDRRQRRESGELPRANVSVSAGIAREIPLAGRAWSRLICSSEHPKTTLLSQFPVPCKQHRSTRRDSNLVAVECGSRECPCLRGMIATSQYRRLQRRAPAPPAPPQSPEPHHHPPQKSQWPQIPHSLGAAQQLSHHPPRPPPYTA